MQWYYSKNGTQLGPISTEELQAKLGSGEVSPTDLVWKDGMADWLAAGQVTELRGHAPAATVASAPAPAAAQVEVSPYSAPQTTAVPTGAASPVVPGQLMSSGLSVGSMVCGILAPLTCCFWCLSGPLAVVAIVLGHVSLSKIKAEPNRYGGKGMAKAGLVTGYLGLLLMILFWAFSMWASTLKPDEVEKLDFLPSEVREKLREQREARGRMLEKIEEQNHR